MIKVLNFCWKFIKFCLYNKKINIVNRQNSKEMTVTLSYRHFISGGAINIALGLCPSPRFIKTGENLISLLSVYNFAKKPRTLFMNNKLFLSFPFQAQINEILLRVVIVFEFFVGVLCKLLGDNINLLLKR